MSSSGEEVDSSVVIRDPITNITTISVPFKRSGLFKVGGRGTIVRLRSGNLAVFSPTQLTPAVRTRISTLSPSNAVTYLIAPDLEHHISLHQWHTAFPSATIIGPEGLGEKRAKSSTYSKQPVPITHHLAAKNKSDIRISEEFDREFDIEFVDAHLNKEIVLFHRESKTLIEADLLWNLPAAEQHSRVAGGAEGGFLQNFFVWAFGTTGNAMGQRRALWWGISAKDRTGFNRSIKRINKWDFENIVPCHGDIILGTGKDVFERVFRWHIDAKEA